LTLAQVQKGTWVLDVSVDDVDSVDGDAVRLAEDAGRFGAF
jgi:hypothetical protein